MILHNPALEDGSLERFYKNMTSWRTVLNDQALFVDMDALGMGLRARQVREKVEISFKHGRDLRGTTGILHTILVKAAKKPPMKNLSQIAEGNLALIRAESMSVPANWVTRLQEIAKPGGVVKKP